MALKAAEKHFLGENFYIEGMGLETQTDENGVNYTAPADYVMVAMYG